jgi:hypothetical protein
VTLGPQGGAGCLCGSACVTIRSVATFGIRKPRRPPTCERTNGRVCGYSSDEVEVG